VFTRVPVLPSGIIWCRQGGGDRLDGGKYSNLLVGL